MQTVGAQIISGRWWGREGSTNFGPLLLGVMNKTNKEMTLPKNAKLNWDSQAREVEIGSVTLTPINDFIDNMYERETYKRQVLWKSSQSNQSMNSL